MASSSSVNVTNTTVFIAQMNAAGSQIGMSPIAPGTPIDQAAQAYSQQLQKTLLAKWTTLFPNASLGSNMDNGYMGPLSALNQGTPSCVVDQVKMDLSNWGLPMTSNLPDRIAKTICMGVSTQGGVTGFNHGVLQITSNETLVWLVGYGTYDISQSESGVVYSFAAALSL